MRRGFFRLGVLLTCIWLALVTAVVIFQYSSANPFCQFDVSVEWLQECQSFFWSWVPIGDKSATISLRVLHTVLVGVLPPVLSWVLGLATGWVVSGFRASAT